MRIQNNMVAINAHRQLAFNQANQAKSTEKLSSGFRINRAADDAAGLSISEKMRAQIRGLTRAAQNTQDGISLIQAAEGALQESHSILQRMRELAVQGANDVNAAEDRFAIMNEIEQLAYELDRISTTTNFNGMFPLNGQYALDVSGEGIDWGALINEDGVDFDPGELSLINLQAGANPLFADVISIQLPPMNTLALLTGAFWEVADDGGTGTLKKADALELDNGDSGDVHGEPTEDAGWEVMEDLPFASAEDTIGQGVWTIRGFQLFLRAVDGTYATEYREGDPTKAPSGIALISKVRSELGAVQNRLDHTLSNLNTIAENVTAAESRIRDVDMAGEMMNFTKQNILNQAATAMLAQANMIPQTVLQLLQ